MQATVNITVGSQVWVEDSTSAWAEAEVLAFNGKQVRARTQDGKTVGFCEFMELASNPESHSIFGPNFEVLLVEWRNHPNN